MKIFILGSLKESEKFCDAEEQINRAGNVAINPLKVMQALPPVSISDFAVVSIELIRISDAIYLLDGWEKDLIASLEKSNADRLEKPYWECSV